MMEVTDKPQVLIEINHEFISSKIVNEIDGLVEEGVYYLKGWIPSLLLPIYVNNIHKAKHGSDSETYDTEGRFDPAKFDAIFTKYSRKHPDMLSFWELQCMLAGNRNLNDFFGWLAAEIEWVFIYILIRNKKGFIEKEQVRAMFDGSLFEMLEKKNTQKKQR